MRQLREITYFVKRVQILYYLIIRIIGTVIFFPEIPIDDPTPLD
jgi:hypothetical protein